jgi:hypothetical protein
MLGSTGLIDESLHSGFLFGLGERLVKQRTWGKEGEEGGKKGFFFFFRLQQNDYVLFRFFIFYILL